MNRKNISNKIFLNQYRYRNVLLIHILMVHMTLYKTRNISGTGFSRVGNMWFTDVGPQVETKLVTLVLGVFFTATIFVPKYLITVDTHHRFLRKYTTGRCIRNPRTTNYMVVFLYMQVHKCFVAHCEV